MKVKNKRPTIRALLVRCGQKQEILHPHGMRNFALEYLRLLPTRSRS
jgi:hypothetical protein